MNIRMRGVRLGLRQRSGGRVPPMHNKLQGRHVPHPYSLHLLRSRGRRTYGHISGEQTS